MASWGVQTDREVKVKAIRTAVDRGAVVVPAVESGGGSSGGGTHPGRPGGESGERGGSNSNINSNNGGGGGHYDDAGRDVFIVMTYERTVAEADRVTDFSEGDRLLVTRTSQIWYDRIDSDRDGNEDATVLYDAATNGRIYAVLDDFIGPLDSDDFYGSNITAVIQI
jgi:hypothetical protein